MSDIIKIGCGFALGKAMPALVFFGLVAVVVALFFAYAYGADLVARIRRRLKRGGK